jgi:hypothetical protein
MNQGTHPEELPAEVLDDGPAWSGQRSLFSVAYPEASIGVPCRERPRRWGLP